MTNVMYANPMWKPYVMPLRMYRTYAWSGCEARHDCQALMLRGVVILQRAGGRGRGCGFMHAAIARRSGV